MLVQWTSCATNHWLLKAHWGIVTHVGGGRSDVWGTANDNVKLQWDTTDPNRDWHSVGFRIGLPHRLLITRCAYLFTAILPAYHHADKWVRVLRWYRASKSGRYVWLTLRQRPKLRQRLSIDSSEPGTNRALPKESSPNSVWWWFREILFEVGCCAWRFFVLLKFRAVLQLTQI